MCREVGRLHKVSPAEKVAELGPERRCLQGSLSMKESRRGIEIDIEISVLKRRCNLSVLLYLPVNSASVLSENRLKKKKNLPLVFCLDFGH